MKRLLPASLCLLALGCVPDEEWEELDLSVVPFANEWVDRDSATRTVLLAEGYTCPDGVTARVHVVEPTGIDTPAPLALLLHGRAFDWIGPGGDHFEDADRLNADWADGAVEDVLGLSAPEASGRLRGAWAAALLESGYAIALPANCWGDLWHGRGRNDLDEGFARLGARLAHDAIGLAAARPGITDQRVIAIGLGEGGRGIAELGLDGVPLDGIVVDASPDWLSPILATPSLNQRLILGLQTVWSADVDGEAAPAEQLDQLRGALQRDSLVHLVSDLGFRVPAVYAWSSLDERIDPDQARPAAETIAAAYPASRYRVVDWQESTHAPSNTDRGLDSARDFLAFLQGVLGPFEYVEPPEPAAP